MADNLVVGGDVKGDITSCKIDNQMKSVDRSGIFSIQQKTTYVTYDVCNKKILADYSVPEFTGFGIAIIFATIIVVIIVICGTIVHWIDGY
jgi:hypothetical protein